MHDINQIYSQYMVDKVLNERRDQASISRRAQATTTPVPLMARVMALLRWRRPGAEAIEPAMRATPTVEGA